MTTSTLNVGDVVSVLIDGVCTSNNALLTCGFGGDVIAVTEKAVKLEATTRNGKVVSAWLPRKALGKITDRGNFGNHPAKSASLARWFKPTGWTETFIRITTESSNSGALA